MVSKEGKTNTCEFVSLTLKTSLLQCVVLGNLFPIYFLYVGSDIEKEAAK